MNILVTGANGQLGCEMRRLGAVSPNNYIFTDVAELDITDADAVMSAVRQHSIAAIVNCAAYTNVGEPLRMSTATSSTAPLMQRTSLLWQ